MEMDGLLILWQDTGLANFQWQQLVMIAVGCLLLYLAIVRQFEPLLLLPIGFGAILANIPNGEIGRASCRERVSSPV